MFSMARVLAKSSSHSPTERIASNELKRTNE
jgi:hypothetical protein